MSSSVTTGHVKHWVTIVLIQQVLIWTLFTIAVMNRIAGDVAGPPVALVPGDNLRSTRGTTFHSLCYVGTQPPEEATFPRLLPPRAGRTRAWTHETFWSALHLLDCRVTERSSSDSSILCTFCWWVCSVVSGSNADADVEDHFRC